jgi:hypothetical protein
MAGKCLRVGILGKEDFEIQKFMDKFKKLGE